jgi:hypothetical protein
MTQAINAVLVLYFVAMSGMGLEAFVAKGSTMSLSGVVLGVLMLVSLFVWKKNPRGGRIMSLAVGVLGLFPVFLALKKGTFAPYPHAVILGLSLVSIAFLGAGHMAAQKARKES